MDTPPVAPGWRARLADLRDRLPVRVVGAGMGVVAIVLVATLLLRPAGGPPPEINLPRAGDTTTPVPPAAGRTGAGSAGSAGSAAVTVHAAGAVAHPGVYTLPSGARVADLLVAAGGALPEAALDQLNLAARISDGDRVYVPRAGEQPAAGSPAAAAGPGSAGTATTTGAQAGPLDLNTATVEQLDTLPGVGPATAQAIVSYRTRHGRFRSVTELLDVPGVGPSRLEAIRPLVKV